MDFGISHLYATTSTVRNKKMDILLQHYNIFKRVATNLWIKFLWNFVYKYTISLRSLEKFIPTKIRKEDREIINKLETLGYIETDLIRLSRARKCLKVSYI